MAANGSCGSELFVVQQTTLLSGLGGRGKENKLKVVGGSVYYYRVGDAAAVAGIGQKCLVDYTNTQGARNPGDETP